MKQMNKRTARTLHRRLWGWLAETGCCTKVEWPDWDTVIEEYGCVKNGCFACQMAINRDKSRGDSIASGCQGCPLDWDHKTGICGELYLAWQNTHSKGDRKERAAQIRDLPWKGIPDLRPGDRVRIREWDDMEVTYGSRPTGSIDARFGFTQIMKTLCGKESVVKRVTGAGCVYLIDQNGESVEDGWSISTDMLELLTAVDDDEVQVAEKRGMSLDEYNRVICDTMARCTDVLCKKRAEYATEDVFHTFNVAAKLEGATPQAALAGMMAKHTASVFDMCFSEEEFSTELWDEKICDHINYLLILRAMVEAEK